MRLWCNGTFKTLTLTKDIGGAITVSVDKCLSSDAPDVSGSWTTIWTETEAYASPYSLFSKAVTDASENLFTFLAGDYVRVSITAASAAASIIEVSLSAIPLIWSESTFFSAGSNAIFEETGHNFIIASSGDGSGNNTGFKSTNSPYSSPTYAFFAGKNEESTLVRRYCPLPISIAPCVDIDQSIAPPYLNKLGRYIRSKTLAQMNVTVSSWKKLKNITISWIAGTGTNGADKPDLHRMNDGEPNQTGLPTDGYDGDYHSREDLYVEFFDNNDLPIGERFRLWKPKSDLTLAELNPSRPGGHPPGTPNPFSVHGVYYTYPDVGGLPPTGGASDEKEFTTTIISAADFNTDLYFAKFFVIRQTRYTDVLDNYGVKYVNLEFEPF